MHLCPHISVASAANTPKAISEAAAQFLTYCGGLTAPSAGEVLSLLHADATLNARVVRVFILFLHNCKKNKCFFFFFSNIGSASK